MNGNRWQIKPGMAEVAALGFCGLLVVFHGSAGPIWILSVLKSGRLSPSGTGTLAALEAIMMAIGTLGFTAVQQKLSPRVATVTAVLVVAIANLIAALPSIEALITGRLLGGLAIGVISSCNVGVVARRPDALKVFAILSGVSVLGAATVSLMLPLFAGDHGSVARLFLMTSAIGVVATIACLPAISGEVPQSRSDEKKTGRIRLAPVLACLAYVAIGIGAGSVGTYGLVIGQRLGFSIASLGQVNAIALPMGLIGSIAAHRFGERAGLIGPVFFGLLIVPATWLVMVRTDSLLVYGSTIAVGMATFSFIGPYLMALISRLDPAGRIITAMPAFVLVGIAAGPKLGGSVLAHSHFRVLAYVGTICFVLSLVLFMAAIFLAKQSNMWDRDILAGT